jgi:hypothetical protein
MIPAVVIDSKWRSSAFRTPAFQAGLFSETNLKSDSTLSATVSNFFKWEIQQTDTDLGELTAFPHTFGVSRRPGKLIIPVDTVLEFSLKARFQETLGEYF